jgi:hypothetical protein
MYFPTLFTLRKHAKHSHPAVKTKADVNCDFCQESFDDAEVRGQFFEGSWLPDGIFSCQKIPISVYIVWRALEL